MDFPHRDVQYTTTDDGVAIAFWEIGSGDPLIITHNLSLNHAEAEWTVPSIASFYLALAERYRVIRFDPRGFGMSGNRFEEWGVEPSGAQAGMSISEMGLDISAVAEACGIDRFALMAVGSVGPVAIEFAAEHPDVVTQLVLCEAVAKIASSWLDPLVRGFQALAGVAADSGREVPVSMWETVVPEAELDAWTNLTRRAGVAASDIYAVTTAQYSWDAESRLADIRAPTLVLSARNPRIPFLSDARRVVAAIPGAQLRVVDGKFAPYVADRRAVLEAIGELLEPQGRRSWSVAAPDAVERKLVAIVSADVVGYSRLMSADEVATVRTLTAYRDEMGLLVGQHRGRVVDSPGDNLLMEFTSATAAVQCAWEMQRMIAARNAGLEPERRMEFRMGVHLGEVMVEGDRIYGEGVNVAARLEAMAETGGICVSKSIRDQVAAKVDIGFADVGEHSLKNIPEPVRLFRLEVAAAEDAVDSTDGHIGDAAAGRALSPGATEDGRAAWIAVLPFDNLSDDPAQDYFADGITEDVISGLAAFRSLRVIARSSSARYKAAGASIAEIASELGVRFVLEGSVRKARNRVRVAAQLIEATGSHQVWADRYDAELVDIFDVQDRITQSIVGAIDPAIRDSEADRISRTRSGSMDAWDHVQRGWWDYHRFKRGANLEARRHFEVAIELDPGYAEAHAGLALTHFSDRNWRGDRAHSIDLAYQEAKKAVELDDHDAVSYGVLAHVSVAMGRLDSALQSATRAIELNPSLPIGHNALASAKVYGGEPQAGIQAVTRALALSPHGPVVPWSFGLRALGHFLVRDYDAAVADTRTAIKLRYGYRFGRVVLIAALTEMGCSDEAAAELEAALRLHPHMTTALLDTHPFRDGSDRDRLVAGLRAAGLDA